jgi:hypothetical protein
MLPFPELELKTGLWSSYTGNLSGHWFDPADTGNWQEDQIGNAHQIVVTSNSALGSGMYVTHDDWATSTFIPIASSFSSLKNLQIADGYVFYMKKRSLYMKNDETDVSEINMSGIWGSGGLPGLGANSPYNGLFVRLSEPTVISTNIRVHAVQGEPVFTVEEPLWGDRSVVDVLDYPERHTREITEVHYHHHIPQGLNIGDIAMWDGTMWIVGPASMLPYFADVIATPVSTGVPEDVYAGASPVVATI